MREGPSESVYRNWFQTTSDGFGKEPRSRAQEEKARRVPGQVSGKKKNESKFPDDVSKESK